MPVAARRRAATDRETTEEGEAMSTAPTETLVRDGDHDGADAPREVPHLTASERAARGRAERAEVPRSAHAAFLSLIHI